MPKILWFNHQFSSKEAQEFGLNGGVGHYRQAAPAKYLTEYEHTHAGHSLMNLNKEETEKSVVSLVQSHDLVFSKNLQNPYTMMALLSACDHYNKPLYIDFDDNVLADDDLSPEKFAYPEHSNERHFLQVLMSEATGITVSVPSLVDIYKPYNSNVVVAGNYIDPECWKGIKNGKRKDARVVIGWAASASHVPDHVEIYRVIKRVIQMFPDVVFSFMGHMKPEWMILQGISDKNWCTYPGIGWWDGHPQNSDTYPKRLAAQGYDIGLAPLIKSQFNAARSLTKYYEYSMLGIPTVASAYGPYYHGIDSWNDGVLCISENDWVNALAELITNTKLRKKIGDKAYARVVRDYSYPEAVREWRNLVKSAIHGGFKPAKPSTPN